MIEQPNILNQRTKYKIWKMPKTNVSLTEKENNEDTHSYICVCCIFYHIIFLAHKNINILTG